MATQAPVHVESIDFIGQRHFIDLPVAGGTADALIQVDAVIKVNVIGKIMDARPLNRLARCPAIPNGLRYGSIRPDLRMAAHTGLGGRYTRISRVLHGCVAVAAINTVVLDMVLVAKRDGLLRRHLNGGDPRTPVDNVSHGERGSS